MEKKEFLEVAKIINTHGVAGELKLECRCDSFAVLKKIPEVYIDGISHAVIKSREINGGYVLMLVDGISDLDEAMKYKNKLMYARREHVKKAPGAHFICDMIGLDVIDASSGKVYDTLESVEQVSVQQIYGIKTENGTVLMPNVPAFVKEIDEERGIFVTPIPGFFDGDGENEI